MSVYAYLNPISKELKTDTSGDKKSLHSSADFADLRRLDESYFKDNVEYFSIQQRGDHDNGFIFTPGHYIGPGYKVLIEKTKTTERGSDRHSRLEEVQDLFGEFETIQCAKDFWELLLTGEILPTIPLERTLTLNEQAYAKQASLAVANSASIRELSARLDQAMNHIQSLQQARQDKVAVPA